MVEVTPGVKAVSENMTWLLAGGVLGFLLNLASTACYPWFAQNTRRVRRRFVPQVNRVLLPTTADRGFCIGEVCAEWKLLQWSFYKPGQIVTTHSDLTRELRSDFLQLREDLRVSIEARSASGEVGLPFNGSKYKLDSFDFTRREIVDGDELPILLLNFSNTDYFTQMVTNLNVGNPTRDRLARQADLSIQPVAEFASVVGVNINLITKDDFLIIGEQSSHSAKAGGALRCSIGEGIMRPMDQALHGGPNPYRTAVRGICEELGIEVREQSVEFTAFGADPILCEYHLVGWCKLDQTREEIENLRAGMAGKDKWETHVIHFVPYRPDAIARFIMQNENRWYGPGLAAVMLSLYQTQLYSKTHITRSFVKARRDTSRS